MERDRHSSGRGDSSGRGGFGDGSRIDNIHTGLLPAAHADAWGIGADGANVTIVSDAHQSSAHVSEERSKVDRKHVEAAISKATAANLKIHSAEPLIVEDFCGLFVAMQFHKAAVRESQARAEFGGSFQRAANRRCDGSILCTRGAGKQRSENRGETKRSSKVAAVDFHVFSQCL